mgnify:CR=1 FL=1
MVVSKFDGKTIYGKSLTLETLDQFLGWFDELEYLTATNMYDIVSRPEAYARKFDLAMLYDHLNEAIKPEYHDNCIKQIQEALADDTTADQLLKWWEPLYCEDWSDCRAILLDPS